MGRAELGLLLSGTHPLLCTRETFPKNTCLSSTGPGYINQRQYHSKGSAGSWGTGAGVGLLPSPLCRGMAGFGHPRGPREGGSRTQCPSDQKVSASGNYCPHSPSDHPDSGPPSLTT